MKAALAFFFGLFAGALSQVPSSQGFRRDAFLALAVASGLLALKAKK
jgi:hypothetical protein